MTFWKRMLSYITEVPVETTSSDYNKTLYVCMRRGRYQLCTENAIYSYADLYDNFSKAFDRLDLDRLPGDNVLILGFGLGSIPYMLEKVYHRDYYYTVVEIDLEVLQLANRYTLPDLKSGISSVCMDAYEFVMYCEDTYDLIAVDLFRDDVIPEEFEETEFLERLGELLNPGGLLMYNRLSFHRRDKDLSNQFFNNRFKVCFPNAVNLDVDGNFMLLNEKELLKS